MRITLFFFKLYCDIITSIMCGRHVLASELRKVVERFSFEMADFEMRTDLISLRVKFFDLQ